MEIKRERYGGRMFGEGNMLGNDRYYFERRIGRRCRALRWSQGCLETGENCQEMEKRLGECAMVWGLIKQKAAMTNLPLLLGLGRSGTIPPMRTPWGHALPRILIEIFRKGGKKTSENILNGLDILEKVVKEGSEPAEMMVKLGEEAIRQGVNPRMVIGYMMAKEILKERGGNKRLYLEVQEALKKSEMWPEYLRMEGDRTYGGEIVELKDLE